MNCLYIWLNHSLSVIPETSLSLLQSEIPQFQTPILPSQVRCNAPSTKEIRRYRQTTILMLPVFRTAPQYGASDKTKTVMLYCFQVPYSADYQLPYVFFLLYPSTLLCPSSRPEILVIVHIPAALICGRLRLSISAAGRASYPARSPVRSCCNYSSVRCLRLQLPQSKPHFHFRMTPPISDSYGTIIFVPFKKSFFYISNQ